MDQGRMRMLGSNPLNPSGCPVCISPILLSNPRTIYQSNDVPYFSLQNALSRRVCLCLSIFRFASLWGSIRTTQQPETIGGPIMSMSRKLRRLMSLSPSIVRMCLSTVNICPVINVLRPDRFTNYSEEVNVNPETHFNAV